MLGDLGGLALRDARGRKPGGKSSETVEIIYLFRSLDKNIGLDGVYCATLTFFFSGDGGVREVVELLEVRVRTLGCLRAIPALVGTVG